MNRVLGIDLSHHNLTINFDVAFNAGIRFAYIKQTEGTYFKDPLRLQNVSGADKKGIIPLPYHFYNENHTAIAQARYFHQHSAIKKGVAILDVEKPPGYPVMTAARVYETAEEIGNLFGREPIIYTSSNYMGPAHMSGSNDEKLKLARFRLAVAQYPFINWRSDLVDYLMDRNPLTPTQWLGEWAIWQFTEKGPGHLYGRQDKGTVDLNFYNGNYAAMVTDFIEGSTPPPVNDSALPKPPQIPTLPQARVINLRGVNIRKAPEVAMFNKIGSLAYGEAVRIAARKDVGPDIWMFVIHSDFPQDPRYGWVAWKHQGKQYLEWINGII